MNWLIDSTPDACASRDLDTTSRAPVGGDFTAAALAAQVTKDHPWADDDTVARIVRYAEAQHADSPWLSPEQCCDAGYSDYQHMTWSEEERAEAERRERADEDAAESWVERCRYLGVEP